MRAITEPRSITKLTNNRFTTKDTKNTKGLCFVIFVIFVVQISSASVCS